jgi:hypothetical protein
MIKSGADVTAEGRFSRIRQLYSSGADAWFLDQGLQAGGVGAEVHARLADMPLTR